MICLLYQSSNSGLSCFSLCQQRNEFCKCIEQEIMDTMFGNNILSLFIEHLVQSMAQSQAVIVVLEDTLLTVDGQRRTVAQPKPPQASEDMVHPIGILMNASCPSRRITLHLGR